MIVQLPVRPVEFALEWRVMPNCTERKSLMGKRSPRGALLDEIARIKMVRRLVDINHAGDRTEAGKLRRGARKRRCTAEIDGCAGRLSEEVMVARGLRIVETSKNRNQSEYVGLPLVALSRAQSCQFGKSQESLSPSIWLRHRTPNRYAVCWTTSTAMQQSTVSRIVR
jgi:hypothetical protein